MTTLNSIFVSILTPRGTGKIISSLNTVQQIIRAIYQRASVVKAEL